MEALAGETIEGQTDKLDGKTHASWGYVVLEDVWKDAATGEVRWRGNRRMSGWFVAKVRPDFVLSNPLENAIPALIGRALYTATERYPSSPEAIRRGYRWRIQWIGTGPMVVVRDLVEYELWDMPEAPA